ncbi:MAG: CHASE2 domain-containing protein, partial [Bacteroidota bacterium]|nr:CHASE2 domain-containing protein [Bacteroidota bacterium]
MSKREKLKRFLFKKNVRIVFSAMLGLASAWMITITSLGHNAELNVLDLQFRLAQNSRKPDSSVVILTIDQNSLQYFKRNSKISWPWSRDFYALTTEYLAKGGAKAIVYDFHFNEPDEDRVSSSGKENDSLFAHSIRQAGNVFLSAQLTNQEAEDLSGDTLVKVLEHTPRIKENVTYNFNKTYAPLLSFQEGARDVGVVNFIPDDDGVCRSMPLIYHLNDK